MLKTRSRLIIIMLILALQIGCTSEPASESLGQETAVVDTVVQTKGIPFKKLLYSKNSSNFEWQWSGNEEIEPDIADKYASLSQVAPGGFLVKETDTEYYICVSVGGKESVTEGFVIQSLNFPEQSSREESALYIHVTPVSGENSVDGQMKGEVFVRSLISVSKANLPQGASINSITMRLDS